MRHKNVYRLCGEDFDFSFLQRYELLPDPRIPAYKKWFMVNLVAEISYPDPPLQFTPDGDCLSKTRFARQIECWVNAQKSWEVLRCHLSIRRESLAAARFGFHSAMFPEFKHRNFCQRIHVASTNQEISCWRVDLISGWSPEPSCFSALHGEDTKRIL